MRGTQRGLWGKRMLFSKDGVSGATTPPGQAGKSQEGAQPRGSRDGSWRVAGQEKEPVTRFRGRIRGKTASASPEPRRALWGSGPAEALAPPLRDFLFAASKILDKGLAQGYIVIESFGKIGCNLNGGGANGPVRR